MGAWDFRVAKLVEVTYELWLLVDVRRLTMLISWLRLSYGSVNHQFYASDDNNGWKARVNDGGNQGELAG